MLKRLFRSEKSAKSSPSADRRKGDPLSEYNRLRRANEPIPPALMVDVGNLFRDVGSHTKAAARYLDAVKLYLHAEAWSSAERMLARAAQYLGSDDDRLRPVRLQIAVGRGDRAAANQYLDEMAGALRPSQAAAINRMVEIVDEGLFRDPEFEIRLADHLIALGRPSLADDRLEVALSMAERARNTEMADRIRVRLSTPDVVNESEAPGDGGGEVETEPMPSAEVDEALPPSHPPREVRLVGTDAKRRAGAPGGEQVEDLIRQLREGLREQIPEEDADSHYELGVSFLSMKLYDQAVEAFQAAYRSPTMRARAAEGLAEALLEQGNAKLALRVVKMALDAIGEQDDAKCLGLLYWNARALEALGQGAEASELYERILVLNLTFRDTNERLETLST